MKILLAIVGAFSLGCKAQHVLIVTPPVNPYPFPEKWVDKARNFSIQKSESRLGVPEIYGIDPDRTEGCYIFPNGIFCFDDYRWSSYAWFDKEEVQKTLIHNVSLAKRELIKQKSPDNKIDTFFVDGLPRHLRQKTYIKRGDIYPIWTDKQKFTESLNKSGYSFLEMREFVIFAAPSQLSVFDYSKSQHQGTAYSNGFDCLRWEIRSYYHGKLKD